MNIKLLTMKHFPNDILTRGHWSWNHIYLLQLQVEWGVLLEYQYNYTAHGLRSMLYIWWVDHEPTGSEQNR